MSAFESVHDVFVTLKPDDAAAGKFFFQEPFDVITFEDANAIRAKIFNAFQRGKVPVNEIVSIGFAQRRAVIQVRVPLGVKEQTGMDVGLSRPDHT